MKIPDEVEITLLTKENYKLKKELAAMIYLLESNLDIVKLGSKKISSLVLKMRKKLDNKFKEP